MVQWQNEGKLLADTDIIRVTFDGVTMESSTCTSAVGCTPTQLRIESGSLNDMTYDVPYSTCVSRSYIFQSTNNTGIVAWHNLFALGCATRNENTAVTLSPLTSGANAGKLRLVVAIPSIAIFFHAMFGQCELEDGMILDNGITSLGCFTNPDSGVSVRAGAYGGTAQLTRVC